MPGSSEATRCRREPDALDPPPAGHLDGAPLTARDGEHRVDRRGRGRWRTEPSADDASGQRERKAGERVRVVGRVFRRKCVEQQVVFTHQGGLPGEHLREIALRTANELGHHLAPQPHPAVMELVVHRVAYRSPPQPGADLVRVGAAQIQHRAPEPAAHGRHAGETRRAAPPQQREQHRLRLVVACVPDEDRGRVGVVGRAARALRSARRGLRPRRWRSRRRRPPSPGPRRRPRRRHLAPRARVVLGSVAQPVVDVHRHDVEVTGASEREQGERVGPAGATHDNPRTGSEVVDAAHPRRPARHRTPVRSHRGADRRRSPVPRIRSSSAVSRTPRRRTMRRSPA